MIYDTDAELYDLQYAGYRDDVPFYLRLADDFGSPVLELGAGTGRVTEALARAGHSVVAVDSSPAMLERATARLARAGVADRVELVAGDMRTVERTERFPLVIAPFNALMHLYTLADQDAALTRVAAHLAPGGLFAFDLYAPRFGAMGVVRSEPYWSDLRRPDDAENGAESGAGRSDLFLVQHNDETAQVLTSTYYHDVTSSDGQVRRSVSTLRQRYFTRFEVERALAHAGLRLELYGGFDRSRFDAASELLVCLARSRS